MDDLSGLLVEGFGLRPRDRAPMAASKARATASRAPSTSASVPPPPKAPNPAPSWTPSPDYDLDTVFGAPAPARPPSVLDDDLFGGFSASSPPSAHADDDIFGSFASAPANYDHAGAGGDLLGDFDGGSGGKGMNSGGDPARGGSGSLDELIPGFGGSSPPRISEVYHNRSSGYAKSTEKMSKDSFIDLDSTVSTSHSSGSFVNAFEELDILSGSVKSDRTSTAGVDDSSIFDEFQKPESLFSSTVKKNRKPSRTEDNKNNMRPAGLNGFHGSSVIDDFMFTEPKVASDPLLDLLTKPPHSTRPTDANRVYASPMKSDQPQRNSMKHVESADDIWFSVSESSVKQSSVPPANIRKATSSPNILDDWNSLFGAPSSGEFQEIEGEPEERRKARLERHRRTLERAAKALGEKNERDIQMEREHAERHRISEGLDIGIKRWAAGKEGNLRALLSSLQDVLWPECGWQPVSLTDLITSASVKKVYRKATLCVHPDKVQQKGANLQQKYTAEKVFDLLKEAWKKFTVEELS